MRVAIVASLAAVTAGFIWVFTVGSLLGMLLIIGGVGALGVVMGPMVIEQFAVFLSTGRFRRR